MIEFKRRGLLLVSMLLLTLLPLTTFAEDPLVFILAWGTTGLGPGEFQDPHGIGSDAAGNIYVADTGNHRLQRFNGDGVFLAEVGGVFAGPGDVAVAPDGMVFVGDGSMVRVFSPTLTFVRQFSSVGGSIVMNPTGTLFYTTALDSIFALASADGHIVHRWKYAYSGINFPQNVAVGPSGAVYIGVGGENVVRVYSGDGAVLLREWGVSGEGPGQFDRPIAVTVDDDENIFVSDANSRVQKFSSTGSFLAQFGTLGTNEGEITAARDLTVDHAGNVFTLEPTIDRVQKWGRVSTPALRTSWGRLKSRWR